MQMWSRKKIFGAVLLLELIQFLLQAECNVNDYMHVSYVLNYSYGRGSRLLIGTLADFIFRGELTSQRIYLFYLFFLFIAIVLTAFLFTEFIYRTENRKLLCGKLFFSIFFLTGPASLKYLERGSNVGRFDLYLLLITLVGIIIILHIRLFFIQIVLLTLISCIALAIHQIFFSIFFPLFGIYVLYHFLFISRKWYEYSVVCLCTVILGCVFVYFQFFAHLDYNSFPELMRVVESQTELPISKVPVEYEYFKTLKDHLFDLQWERRLENGYMNWISHLGWSLIHLIQLSPLIIVILGIWKNMCSYSPKETKWKYYTLLLPMFLFLPAFVIAIDWLRWIAAMMIVIIYTFILLYMLGDCLAQRAFLYLGNVFVNNKSLCMTLLLYVCSLDAFGAIIFDTQTFCIINYLDSNFALICFLVLYDNLIIKVFLKNQIISIPVRPKNFDITQIKMNFLRYKAFYIRLAVYTACISVFFFINSFYIVIYENQKSLIYIIGPYMIVWTTLMVYIYLIRFWGVPIRNNKGCFQLVSFFRYLFAIILLIIIMLLQHGFIFSATEGMVYLQNHSLLKWYYPFGVSLAFIFDYKRVRENIIILSKPVKIGILIATGFSLLWSQGGINSINTLTWTSLYSSMKYATAICLIGIVLFQYYIKNEMVRTGSEIK